MQLALLRLYGKLAVYDDNDMLVGYKERCPRSKRLDVSMSTLMAPTPAWTNTRPMRTPFAQAIACIAAS